MKFVEFTRTLLIQLCWRKGSMRLVTHVFCPNRIMHGFIGLSCEYYMEFSTNKRCNYS